MRYLLLFFFVFCVRGELPGVNGGVSIVSGDLPLAGYGKYYLTPTLPADVYGTNTLTVRADPVYGYRVMYLPSDSSLHIDQCGAVTNTQSTTNIQLAFDMVKIDRRIKKIIATKGIYYIDSSIFLNYEHRNIEVDFGEAWLMLTNQIGNPSALVSIYVDNAGNPLYGPANPGQFSLRIRRLNLDGNLLTAEQTGNVDELYSDLAVNAAIFKSNNGLMIYGNPSTAKITDGLVDTIIDDIRCKNLGASGVAVYWRCSNLKVGYVQGNRIGGHVIGFSSDWESTAPDFLFTSVQKPSVTINSIIAEECCTLFDFSAINKDRINQRSGWAYVKSAYGHNMFGRTKIHGNWGITIDSFTMHDNKARHNQVEQGGVYHDQTGWWPALTVANKYIQYLNIGSMTLTDIPGGGLTVLATDGNVNIDSMSVSNVYRPLAGSSNTVVNNLTAIGCRELGSARFINNWSWTDARHDYWVRLIRNGSGSGGYSDDVLYKAIMTQGTSMNAYNQVQTYDLNNGIINSLGPLVSSRKSVSYSRSSNIVTFNTALNHLLTNEDVVTITGVADATINSASVTVTYISPTSFSYAQAGSDVGLTTSLSGLMIPSYSTVTSDNMFTVAGGAKVNLNNLSVVSETDTNQTSKVIYSTGAGTVVRMLGGDLSIVPLARRYSPVLSGKIYVDGVLQ